MDCGVDDGADCGGRGWRLRNGSIKLHEPNRADVDNISSNIFKTIEGSAKVIKYHRTSIPHGRESLGNGGVVGSVILVTHRLEDNVTYI